MPSPPAWSTRLEAQRHRGTKGGRKCFAILSNGEYTIRKDRKTPLREECMEKAEMNQQTRLLRALSIFLQEWLREFWSRYSGGEIPATLYSLLPSSPCLRVSSRTRRVVNLDFRYCLVAGLIVDPPTASQRERRFTTRRVRLEIRGGARRRHSTTGRPKRLFHPGAGFPDGELQATAWRE